MYDRVKRWVTEQGGRLIYLGGNGLNCEVELHENCSMTVRNGSITSLWSDGMGGFDSRFAVSHESEANLLGVVFTPSGAMTGAPYEVVDADHWVFQGTGLKAGRDLVKPVCTVAVLEARPGTKPTNAAAVLLQEFIWLLVV